MKMLTRAALWLSALLMCAPAMAQHASSSAAPAGYAPEMATVTVPATSTPLIATITSSGATKVSGEPGASCSFATGVGKCGPFTPQLGRDLWVWCSGLTGAAQLYRSRDAGTTLMPLTAGGATWAKWTAAFNEAPITPSAASSTYWLTVTTTTSASCGIEQ